MRGCVNTFLHVNPVDGGSDICPVRWSMPDVADLWSDIGPLLFPAVQMGGDYGTRFSWRPWKCMCHVSVPLGSTPLGTRGFYGRLENSEKSSITALRIAFGGRGDRVGPHVSGLSHRGG